MIESQVPVDMALNCSSLDPSSSTSGTFVSSLPTSPDGTTGTYHVVIPAICLDAGVQYTASLTYAGSGEILVDSVSCMYIPTVHNFIHESVHLLVHALAHASIHTLVHACICNAYSVRLII